MATDRDDRLRSAEALVRQGRLDEAVVAHEDLLALRPSDLGAQNALGDLLVRLGRTEQAVACFMRVGNYYLHEGFFARAAGFYRKVLKVAGHHEPALLGLSTASIEQGLLVEARQALTDLAALYRARGNVQGANEVLARLAGLDAPKGTGVRPEAPVSAGGDARLSGTAPTEPEATAATPVSVTDPAAGVVLATGGEDAAPAAAAGDDGDPASPGSQGGETLGPDEGASTLEAAFSRLREEARPGRDEPGGPQLALGRTYRAAGMAAEARRAFELAARDSAHRFEACVALAELQQDLGDLPGATDCMNGPSTSRRSRPAPGSTRYRLAEVLEAAGEPLRALAVWLELQALSPGFRDVGQRVAQHSVGGGPFTP